MTTPGQFQEGSPHDPFIHEVAIFELLINERATPFDLVRELLSNAASREVNAQNITISTSSTRMTAIHLR